MSSQSPRSAHRRRGRMRPLVPSATARALRDRVDDGMTTAEYAVGTVAACGFAAILFRIVHSQAVTRLLTDIISRALHTI